MAAKRSGHHAIMQWMLEGMPGEILRLNHVNAEHAIPGTMPARGQIKKIVANINRKDLFCFMYNVEQAKIEKWNQYKLFQKRATAFGVKSDIQRQDAILVVRDPFNCLASALKNPALVSKPELMVPILKKHYQQALGDKQFADCYVINFNEWFVSVDYRKKIALDLDMPWIDPQKPHKSVPLSAQGSSFDKRALNGNGDKMKVLERYDQIPKNKLQKLIDAELAELSERLFGLNPFQSASI